MPSGSNAPTSDTQYAGLKITLTGIRSIEDVSDWENATARYYESVYNEHDNAIVVTIRLASQNTKEGSRRFLQQTKQQQKRLVRPMIAKRILQKTPLDTFLSVVVMYSQTMTYHSLDSNNTITELLQLPLNTEEYRAVYIEGLKRSLDGYEDLIEVSSISSPFEAVDRRDNKAIDEMKNGGGFPMGQIIGIVSGITAFLLLVAGFVYYRRSKNDKDSHLSRDTYGDAAEAVDNVSPDLATKSNAMTRGSTSTGLGDMSVASGDYCPRGGEGNTALHHHVEAAEELLTVYAPAGKLGVVIDSPDNGAPTIHNVKVTSPIANKVQIGDRLVAVDDEDVRTMTALKVSKLISRKSSNSRKLTVIRCVVST